MNCLESSGNESGVSEFKLTTEAANAPKTPLQRGIEVIEEHPLYQQEDAPVE